MEVAAAFGLGEPTGPMVFAARGELGRVWRLETSAGVWAVKELFERQVPADAAADVEFQLAAREAGVVAPRPVTTVREGSPLAEVTGGQVRVYEWHDLRPEAGPPPLDRAAEALAAIHGLRFPAAGPPHPWYVEPVAAAVWDTLLARARDAGMPWADRVAAVVPDLVAAAEAVISDPPPDRLQRCHLDFNLDNVLLDGDGLVAVIDWENSGPAVAEQEVAFCLAEFAAGDDDIGDFVTAYREAGGVFDPHGIEVFSLRFAVEAHLLELFARRSLDPATSDENRERAAEAIADKLAAPLTLVRAERLLAAVP